MYVNAFWMGVLCTLVAEIIFVCIAAYVSIVRSEREEWRQHGKEGTNKKRD
jgi:hypothetical protein